MNNQPSGSRASHLLAITAGAAGIGTVVLVMAGQSLIQVGGLEPAFDAPAADIVEFFETRDSQLFAIGSYMADIGLIMFLWFLGGLWAVLRRIEGEPSWRSIVALVSGLTFLASLNNGWQFAMMRIDEGLEPQLARFAFDMGNFGLAASWVPAASLLLAAGWIFLDNREFSRWLGWSAIAIAVGLLAARAAWTSPVLFLPYLLFWVWVIAFSIQMIRQRTSSPAPAGSPAPAT